MSALLYFYLALSVYLVNAMPAFMPPTWMVLVFFLTVENLFPPAVVIIGAIMALLGRMTLYYFFRKWNRFLPKKMSDNYDDLGKIIGKHKALTLPLFLLFAFYPLPSNHLFMVAGLSKLKPKLLAMSFFGGRLLSYTFWVGSAHALDKKVEIMFREGFDSADMVKITILIIILVVGPGLVPWKKVAARLADLCL